jgi:hypothetical protein
VAIEVLGSPAGAFRPVLEQVSDPKAAPWEGEKKMKLWRIVPLFVLFIALPSMVLAQPSKSSGPKWLHHTKKNPHQSSVHHAKPAHYSSKRKTPNR